MQVSELIGYALEDLGVLAAGESAETVDLAAGLARLNMLMGSLSSLGVMLPFFTVDSLVLVPGTVSYTMGSGGTFDTPRPTDIESAYVKDSGGSDYPVKIRPFGEYNLLLSKLTAGRPHKLYYNPTFPYGTIYLYYVPDAAETLYVTSKKPLVRFAAVGDTITLPQEYESVLHHLLVRALASPFGKKLTQEQALDAKVAYDNLIGRNIANSMNTVNFGGMPGRVSPYNINER